MSTASGQIEIQFGTPIVRLHLPDSETINEALRAAILAKEKEHKGVGRSNAGGWHSENDIFEWPVPEIGRLKDAILTLANRTTIALTPSLAGSQSRTLIMGWANVSREGHYNHIHHHPGAAWSGVYYVATGDQSDRDPSSGKIEFIDPRGSVNMFYVPGDPFGQKLLLEPEDGLILMFPSWLRHWVHPYWGTAPRISIAFNVAFDTARRSRSASQS